MIEITGHSVYLEVYGDSPLIGTITMCGGKMCFEANYLLPEYPLEPDELRVILNKLDMLNRELGAKS